MRRLTQEEFVSRCTEIHKGKYDYSKAKYVNANTKICVICPEHGEFFEITVSPHARKWLPKMCINKDWANSI